MENVRPSYVVRRTFTDIDELAESARQWNLDFRQLDRGAFRGDLLQFAWGDVHIGEARFCRSLNQKGTPPAGKRTIAVPVDRATRFVWRGKAINGESLMLFPRGAELASVSGPDFHVYTCSFPEPLLDTACEMFGVGKLDSLANNADALRCSSAALDSVRRCLRAICGAVRDEGATLPPSVSGDRLTRDLPQRLIRAVAESTGRCPPATGFRRSQALAAAEAYVERFAKEDISVGDICGAAGVSQRTLEYAFVERFGIAPKEFLMAFRLHGVRRQLRRADSRRTKIAEIANEWGFWHMGQFAADYRRRFGELPSETLRRRKGK